MLHFSEYWYIRVWAVKHQTSLSKPKIIEIKQNMFFDHSRNNLEISNRKRFQKLLDIWIVSNTLLKDPWIKIE